MAAADSRATVRESGVGDEESQADGRRKDRVARTCAFARQQRFEVDETMPFKYQSGELIHPGDRVLMHGEPGEVEFVADPADPSSDPEGGWYIESHGGGVMILEPKVFGRVFLQDTENAEDLVPWKRISWKNSPYCDLKGHGKYRAPQEAVGRDGG
jgi:hypothetical protein